MTDKEFRRLSRTDLIEIIYELQRSEKALQRENEDLKQQLEDRRVTVSEAGSLAEVLARLSGLFEAAQVTADGYREEAGRLLEEARRTREQADGYREEAGRLLEEARRTREQADDWRGESPDLDGILCSVKEGRYDGGREV